MPHHETKSIFTACPTLQRLGISVEQLTLLTHQGFIAKESRRGRLVYRLHYRDTCKRQRAVNLPASALVAVEKELEELQTGRRAERRLAELNRSRRQLDRERKTILAPLVEEHGLRFHGHTIRAPRWRVVDRHR